MRVVVPKESGGGNGKLYYNNYNTGSTAPIEKDITYIPNNILLDSSLLRVDTSPPPIPNTGDVYHNVSSDKYYIYCADGTWKETIYPVFSWGVIQNHLLKDELTGAMKDYVDRGGAYQDNVCPNVIQYFPVYDNTADYTVGDIVEIGFRLILPNGNAHYNSTGVPFKCLTTHSGGSDGSTAKDPLTEPTYWERLPFYNQFAIYDNFINTTWKTRNQDMFLNYQNISDIDFAAILNPQGTTAKFSWDNNTGATVVEEVSLNTRITHNFNEYFFKDFTTRSIAYSEKQLVNVDNVAVTLEGDNNSASSVIVGKSYDIGNALYGYKKQLRDFSKKVTNADGYDYLQKGNHSNKLIVKLSLNNDRARDIYDLLSGLSSTLCLYVLEDGEWVFGYFKDLYMVKENPVLSDYELEINGVI